MSNKPEFELLAEIAKLLKKYGPEAFEMLSRNLSSPDFSGRLISILSTTARVARTVRRNEIGGIEHKGFSKDFRTSLVALEKTEPEKSALLTKLYDDMKAKTVLPTLRNIFAFASDNGLPSITATARDKAIVPFLKTLMPLPLLELKSKLSSIKPVPVKDDRSLEGWSNIILDKASRTEKNN